MTSAPIDFAEAMISCGASPIRTVVMTLSPSNAGSATTDRRAARQPTADRCRLRRAFAPRRVFAPLSRCLFDRDWSGGHDDADKAHVHAERMSHAKKLRQDHLGVISGVSMPSRMPFLVVQARYHDNCSEHRGTCVARRV